MEIRPVQQTKQLLYPLAAAVVLAGCQQQPQPTGGAPLPVGVNYVPVKADEYSSAVKNTSPRGQRLRGRQGVVGKFPAQP